MIQKFRIGIKCESKRDELDPSFGWVEVQLGHVSNKLERRNLKWFVLTIENFCYSL